MGHLGQDQQRHHLKEQEQSGHEGHRGMQHLQLHETLLKHRDRGQKQQHRHFGIEQLTHEWKLHKLQLQLQCGMLRRGVQLKQQIHEKLKQGDPLHEKGNTVT